MALPKHVAIVSTSGKVGHDAVMAIAAAVQKQVTLDLGRIWALSATVSGFARLDQVPADYWRVVIRDDIGLPGVQGAHWGGDNQPYALVRAAADIGRVALTVSHEVLEMLVDPGGNRLIAGPSPVAGQGHVNYLVEICDPVQDRAFAYPIDGLPMCDFVTPDFFRSGGGGACSCSGRLSVPLSVGDGGYISWIDPATNHIWQAFARNGRIDPVDQGAFTPNVPLRYQSDRLAETPSDATDGQAEDGIGAQDHGLRRADAFEAEIARIISAAQAKGEA